MIDAKQILKDAANAYAETHQEELTARFIANPPTQKQIADLVYEEIARIGAANFYSYLADQLRDRQARFKPELDRIGERMAANGGNVMENDFARLEEMEKIINNLHAHEAKFGAMALSSVPFEFITSAAASGLSVN
jgi:hypothetical protein